MLARWMRRTRCRAEDGNLECGVGGIGGIVFGLASRKLTRDNVTRCCLIFNWNKGPSHLEIVSHCHV
jgi:hypothetical protein